MLHALGVERMGVVGHAVGGSAMQPLAQQAPERLTGLFFFDFTYLGIAPRMGTPNRLSEIWYRSFYLMDIAPTLVGTSRDDCRACLGYVIRHWPHRKDAFDGVMENWVDIHLQPGNLEGGFAFYNAFNAEQL